MGEAGTTVAVTDRDRLAARLDAVERTLAGRGEGDSAADDADRTDDPGGAPLGERLDDLEARVADVEAGLQAVRGYVGGVEAVNDDVERRADAALATAERALAAVEERPLAGSAAAGDAPGPSKRDHPSDGSRAGGSRADESAADDLRADDPPAAGDATPDGGAASGPSPTPGEGERVQDPEEAAPWLLRRLREAL